MKRFGFLKKLAFKATVLTSVFMVMGISSSYAWSVRAWLISANNGCYKIHVVIEHDGSYIASGDVSPGCGKATGYTDNGTTYTADKGGDEAFFHTLSDDAETWNNYLDARNEAIDDQGDWGSTHSTVENQGDLSVLSKDNGQTFMINISRIKSAKEANYYHISINQATGKVMYDYHVPYADMKKGIYKIRFVKPLDNGVYCVNISSDKGTIATKRITVN